MDSLSSMVFTLKTTKSITTDFWNLEGLSHLCLGMIYVYLLVDIISTILSLFSAVDMGVNVHSEELRPSQLTVWDHGLR